MRIIWLMVWLCAVIAQGQDAAAIDARVEYSSSDSMVIMGNGVAHMYGDGDLKYKNMGLKAEYIRVSMDSSVLFAKGVLDTVEGKLVGKPVFSEGNDSYQTEEISYNLKTQKGFIRNAISEQGEGYIVADKTKKVEGDFPSTFYICLISLCSFFD